MILRPLNVARWPKFRPKSSKGAGEKISWPEEFVAEFWPNFTESGRKGAEENCQKNFLIS
jgi:hypothetical protein